MAKLIKDTTAEESELLTADKVSMSAEEIAMEVLEDDNEDAIAQVLIVISDCNENCKENVC